MKRAILLIGLLALLLVPPASALVTNNTADTNYYLYNTTLISGSFIHDENYIPREYVTLMIIIGIIFWALSIAAPYCEDLFALISPCWLAAASWYAGYMAKDQMTIVVVGTTIFPVHTQVITPEPVLQILCLVGAVFSALSAVYVIWLRKADTKTSPEDTSKM